MLRQQAQRLPSRDPYDPQFRRLWYVRYADEWLLGLTGSQGEAAASKQELRNFLHHDLHLELNEETTLVTQAHVDCARFLGYAVHGLPEASQHDFRRRRCSNGSMGLRVPRQVLVAQRTRDMRRGKPKALPQRTLDDASPIVLWPNTKLHGAGWYSTIAWHTPSTCCSI